MADLIAIAYDDTTTAEQAMAEVANLQEDLIIQADAVAAIVRDADGTFHTHTNQHAVGAGATWGMFWGFLFGSPARRRCSSCSRRSRPTRPSPRSRSSAAKS